MDGFDSEWFPNSQPANYPYGYVPRAESAPYWSLANQYVLADRMFQSNIGPSYPAHQYLIAGYSANASENPNGIDYSSTPWGCDASAGTTVALAAPNGQDSPGPYPCFDYPTIADEISAKGLTWRYYTQAMVTSGDAGQQWSAFDAVRHIRYGSAWANVITPSSQILQDGQAGNLPDVTWVTPTLRDSDHSGSGSATGPQWVASIVNAIGGSSAWNSTAIFITWDDWGGWYDHVPPSQLDVMGLGMRVPLIVVSPYAKRGYVSHVQHEFGSILKFVEKANDLPSLGQTDARSDDLLDCFDFTQAPRAYAPVKATYIVRHDLSTLPPDSD
jgi:phospholipase C